MVDEIVQESPEDYMYSQVIVSLLHFLLENLIYKKMFEVRKK